MTALRVLGVSGSLRRGSFNTAALRAAREPGVLENAIDWVSRPPERPFIGKPAAIMGASPSVQGTVRAQTHLRQICALLEEWARRLDSRADSPRE